MSTVRKPSSRPRGSYLFIRGVKSGVRRRRRGLSFIVATIILISVAVSVSVAVAFWLGGTVSFHTHVEQLVGQNMVCSVHEGNWTIALQVKNTGTTPALLTSLFLNGREVDTYDAVDAGYIFADEWATNMTQSETLRSGETRAMVVYLDPDRPASSLTSGTLVEVTLHNAGGLDYSTLVKLI